MMMVVMTRNKYESRISLYHQHDNSATYTFIPILTAF